MTEAPPGVTEREVLDSLHRRYGRTGLGQVPRYVLMEQVAFRRRTADLLVLDRYPTSGLRLIFHEVKCSRADWLAEMRNPGKAKVFTDLCDEAWLVTSHRSVARPDEVPDTWGLAVRLSNGVIRTIKPSGYIESKDIPSRDAERQRRRNMRRQRPWNRAFISAMLHSAARTATRSGTTVLPDEPGLMDDID